MEKKQKRNKYEYLITLFRFYRSIPKFIKEKRILLEKKLCNASLSVFQGFNSYNCTVNEIDFLEEQKQFIENFVNSLKGVCQDISIELMEGGNIFTITEKLNMKKATFYHRITEIYDKLINKLDKSKCGGIYELQ